MKRHFLGYAAGFLTVLLICSCGWAGISDQPQPYRKGYQHSESTPHLWLYWNCMPEDGKAMTIDGIVEVKSQSNSPVYGLQLKLIGFDAKDKKESEQLLKIAPYKIFTDIPVPFHLSVPLKGDEADFGLWVYYWFYPAYGGAGKKASRISTITDTWYWTFRDLCPKD